MRCPRLWLKSEILLQGMKQSKHWANSSSIQGVAGDACAGSWRKKVAREYPARLDVVDAVVIRRATAADGLHMDTICISLLVTVRPG
jgi:hypothetical protein